MKQHSLKIKVQRPGSRGGKFWLDDSGNIRYGPIPRKYHLTWSWKDRLFQEWFHGEILAGRIPKIKKPTDREKYKKWWETTIYADAARRRQLKLFKAIKSALDKRGLALLPSKKDPKKKRWQRVVVKPSQYGKLGFPSTAKEAHLYPGHPKFSHEWRDPRGKLQRRYRKEHVEAQKAAKFKRVENALRKIPNLRKTIAKDINSKDTRRRCIGLAVAAIDRTGMRVGDEQYEREFGTYGATTLTKDHVQIRGNNVTFKYTGKKAQGQQHTVDDRTFANKMRLMMRLPGDKVFQYQRGNSTRVITGRDINDYLSGYRITAKDLRTFRANVVFTKALRDFGRAKDLKEAKKNIRKAVDQVAEHLGNTSAVARSMYISPVLIAGYLSGKRLLTRYLRKSIYEFPTSWTHDERKFIEIWTALNSRGNGQR